MVSQAWRTVTPPPDHESLESSSICSVILEIPKLAISSATISPSWQQALHPPTYVDGFTIFGDPWFAVGKQKCVHPDKDPRQEYWWWLVNDPNVPNRWIRGELDEGCLTFDGRAGQPSRISGQLRGQYGSWAMLLLPHLHDGYQYHQISDIIHMANLSLPPGLTIRTDYEDCENPAKQIFWPL